MVTYEQAIDNVRKAQPGWMIRVGFEYPNEYRFTISPGKYYAVDDLAVLTARVNKNTGKVDVVSAQDIAAEIDDIREFAKNRKIDIETRKPVDLTKEQWEEYLLWCKPFDEDDSIDRMTDEEIDAINASRMKN